MKKFLVLTGLVAVQAFYAQANKNVGHFNSLKAYDRIQVELVPAAEAKVSILSHNQKDVEVINKNGELKLRMIASKTMQGETTKIKVFYRELDALQASQGAIIKNQEPLEAENLSLTSNEGSIIDLKIITDQLMVKANSGAIIKVSGKADSQDIVINSGAQFYGKNVESGNTNVTTNAGGTAEVFSNDTVNATTRAGGVIEVYGNPEHKNEQKMLGGKIIFK